VERRNDERDRLRASCRSEIDELLDADDDETSEVANAAAQAAAFTAHRITLPDSDAPERERKAWHTHAAKGGLIVTVVTGLVAGVIEGLRLVGILK
jgi:hypothetical protein